MPIDANIPLAVQPMKLDNPLNMLATSTQIQGMREAMMDKQRARAAQDAINQAMGTAGNPNDADYVNRLATNLASRGQAAALPKITKGIYEGQKTKSVADKNEYETQLAKHDNAIKELASYESPEEAKAAVVAKLQSGVLNQQQAEHAFTMIPNDPAQMRDWQIKTLRSLVNAKDQLATKTTTADFGNRIEAVTSPELAGGGPITTTNLGAKSATPDALIKQNKPDAGDWSPESIEMAAQMYSKTGQMPPVGMGPSALKARDAILKRSYQIASDQNPENPSDIQKNGEIAAENVRNAKITNATQTAIVKGFGKGPEADKVTAFNTLVSHMNTLDEYTDALKNNDINILNKVSNRIAAETGKPAPTTFDGAKTILADEVAKAIIPRAGSAAERQKIADTMKTANSPEQLKQMMESYKELSGAQLNSLELQYSRSGRNDFSDRFLTPAARDSFNKFKAKSTGSAVSPASNPAPADIPQGWVLHQDAKGNKAYVSPDGKQFKEVK